MPKFHWRTTVFLVLSRQQPWVLVLYLGSLDGKPLLQEFGGINLIRSGKIKFSRWLIYLPYFQKADLIRLSQAFTEPCQTKVLYILSDGCRTKVLYILSDGCRTKVLYILSDGCQTKVLYILSDGCQTKVLYILSDGCL